MAQTDRKHRLAAKLRENLKKRKTQAKARTNPQADLPVPHQGERPTDDADNSQDDAREPNR